MATYTVNAPLQAYAQETVGTLTSAIGGTASTYNVARSAQAGGSDHFDRIRRPEQAFITIETAAIRWTVNGTTPTTTATTGVGHLAAAGDTIVISGYQNIANFLAINAVNASGAALRISYFR